MKFRIKYSTGLVEEVDCLDWDSVDAVALSKFGMDSAEQVAETGTTIEVVEEEAEEPSQIDD